MNRSTESQPAEAVRPLVKTIVVRLSPEDAFNRFTGGIGTWWPLRTHSVARERARSVRFGSAVGELIFETDDEGGEHVWGRIVEWDPPHAVCFTWHPEREEMDDVRVRVVFTPENGGTHVELTHSGWERFGDEAIELRSEYDGGWTGVLSLYAEIDS